MSVVFLSSKNRADRYSPNSSQTQGIHMLICQLTILCLQIAAFLMMLYHDCNGRPAREPGGFSAVLTSIIVWPTIVCLYYFAGTYSQILP
ncbi:MAG: hypothetical protein AAGG38_09220 [Planctomycetota bacterium]